MYRCVYCSTPCRTTCTGVSVYCSTPCRTTCTGVSVYCSTACRTTCTGVSVYCSTPCRTTCTGVSVYCSTACGTTCTGVSVYCSTPCRTTCKGVSVYSAQYVVLPVQVYVCIAHLTETSPGLLRLWAACLQAHEHAGVSQRQSCSDNSTSCHTETETADQSFHLTQVQYTDTKPTSPRADPIAPGTWQGGHR